MAITVSSPRSAPSLLRRVARWTGLAVLVVVVVAAGGVGWGYREVRRSLPAVDGEAALPGLSAPVTIARDARGVPAVRGATRVDVARALGYLHGQERFFQMDLARRRAAGELSELVGPGALPLDRGARFHRFRAKARGVVEAADAETRAVVDAYAGGVNAGLRALGAPPLEYLALRASPAPWTVEDSVLVLASMFFQLQDADGSRDLRIGRLYDELPAALADFLGASGSEWDTPLVGEAFPAPWVPGPEILDLRTAPRAASARPLRPTGAGTPWPESSEPEQMPGSNNWAIAGAHTATGAALVANDMHLGIAIPNIWYRASLVWSDAAGVPHTVTGVTLPGLPSLVVGSNGDVAWGFTNSTGDWTDVVEVTVDGADPSKYLTPDGPRPFERVTERIRVRGAPDEPLEIRETIWGPLLPADGRGRLRAVHWVPAVAGGLTLDVRGPETMTSVAEAMEIGPRLGIPAQNFVAADRGGHIGWTIAGRIPRRVRLDTRVPQSWADGQRGWAGWLSAEEYPRVVDPPSGRIVTANNRLVDGEWLAAIGDGGYDQGARARQIRDDVLAVERATPADMLKVQLDDRALFLARWRKVALDVLTPVAIGSSPGRLRFSELVDRTWTGRASVDSVAYRLVRTFRLQVAELAFEALIAPVRRVDPAFPPTLGRAYEGQLWQLLTERPAHLLPLKYPSWDALLVAAVDRTVEQLSAGPGTLADRSWGEFNRAHVLHPLARAVPMLASWPFVPGWFIMPTDPLPGDVHMPRVQASEFGASERFAVSPGREAEGYFHMPVGQSGHPLSPNFADGHRAWVTGEPTPYLPGPAVHTLTLKP